MGMEEFHPRAPSNLDGAGADGARRSAASRGHSSGDGAHPAVGGAPQSRHHDSVRGTGQFGLLPGGSCQRLRDLFASRRRGDRGPVRCHRRIGGAVDSSDRGQNHSCQDLPAEQAGPQALGGVLPVFDRSSWQHSLQQRIGLALLALGCKLPFGNQPARPCIGHRSAQIFNGGGIGLGHIQHCSQRPANGESPESGAFRSQYSSTMENEAFGNGAVPAKI